MCHRRPAASSGTPALSSEAVDEAVSHGSAYINDYVDRSTSVVAEERYVQIIRPGPPNASKRDTDEALEWREDNWIHGRSFTDAKLRRQLISDILMVKTKDGMWRRISATSCHWAGTNACGLVPRRAAARINEAARSAEISMGLRVRCAVSGVSPKVFWTRIRTASPPWLR